VLFLMIAGHALMDFALQPEAMAVEKNRHSATPLQKAVPWYYWLTAHSLCHAGAVWFVTRSPFLALAELVAHWFIDFAKCEKWTNIHADQAMHVGCKIVWYALIVNGVAGRIDEQLLSWMVW
jgi:hypothetical protein